MAILATSLTPLLQVFDMRTSVAWYRDVLGFEVLQTHEPDGHFYWAMLQLGNARLMLNAAYEDELRPPKPPSTKHDDVTLYFACADVDAAYDHVLMKGVVVSPPKVAYYGMKQLYVKDPDGFELCFQQPASP
jgi:uncharacterized glyoxalase superfamily protein PhnB